MEPRLDHIQIGREMRNTLKLLLFIYLNSQIISSFVIMYDAVGILADIADLEHRRNHLHSKRSVAKNTSQNNRYDLYERSHSHFDKEKFSKRSSRDLDNDDAKDIEIRRLRGENKKLKKRINEVLLKYDIKTRNRGLF